MTGGQRGILPLMTLLFWSDEDSVFEGVFGLDTGVGDSSGSGVVELAELERSDANELMLPHVFDAFEEDDTERSNGRVPGVNGFDLDLDFEGENGV